MRKLLHVIASVLTFVLIGLTSFAQSNTVVTTPPLNGGNGSKGVTFNLETNTPINVTEIASALYGSIGAATTVDIWYNPNGPINGQPNISTANGWVLLQNSPTTIGNTGTIPNVLSNITLNTPLTLAPGNYGFYVGIPNSSTGNTVYTTYNAANQSVFTDGTITIYTGTNNGYGGNVPSPINHPRQFNGSVTYEFLGGSSPYANDIGITTILKPSFPSCTFNDSVFVELRNFGTDTLTSATIEWEVNGIPQTPMNWTGTLLPTTSENPLNLGNGYTFQEGDQIRAWTTGTMNGGSVDDSLLNDTATTVLIGGLAGVYTVDPSGSGDYIDFQEAIDDAVTYGICDHVIFQSVGITWNQQLTLPSIPNASSSRTITLTSQSGIAANDTITYTGSSGDNWILNLDNASHYKITNLTLHNPTGRVLVFGNDSDSNLVDGCYIQGDTAQTVTDNSISTIFSDNSEDDYNTFSNNTIFGGSHVWWEGTSATALEVGNKFMNNEFLEFNYYAIRAESQMNIEISDNYMSSSEVSTTANPAFYGGMQLVASNGAQKILRNHIDFSIDGASNNNYNAIEMANCIGTNADQGLLANNKIRGGNPNSNMGQAVGIIMVSCDFQNFYNNTVAVTNNLGITASFANIQGGAANEIVNNNFSTWGASTPSYGYYFDNTTIQSIYGAEHNNIYVDNGQTGEFNGNIYTTLQDWVAGTGYDGTSISANPMFGDLFKLQPCNDSLNASATPLNEITIDFDHQVRDANTPDIGADEFTPVDQFSMPDYGLCAGQIIPLSAPFADTAIWSRDTSTVAGTISFAVVDTINTFMAQNGGVFRVEAINSCGTAIDTFNVVNAQGPDFPNDTNFCADATFELSANVPNATFNWNTGETTSSIAFNAPGQYSVEVVDSNMCSTIDTINVTISPEVQLADSTIICEGSPEFLDAGISGSYNWSTGSTNQTISILSSDVYSITVTDQFGCVSSDTTVATVVPIPSNISWTVNRSFLTGEFTSNANGAVNYAWDFGDGTYSNEANPTHIFPFTTQTYTVTLTVNNECGTATYSDTITIGPNISSVNDIDGGIGFDIFPNPNNGQFTLDIAASNSAEALVEIVDVQGRLVYTNELGSISGNVAKEISLDNIEAGIYFVRLTIGEETQVKRVSVF